jgi:hypothetical protein
MKILIHAKEWLAILMNENFAGLPVGEQKFCVEMKTLPPK